MDKAKAKAKEFGRNLLMRATGGGDSSEEEERRNPRTSRASYCDVVKSPSRMTEKEHSNQGTLETHLVVGSKGLGSASERVLSPKRMFSAEDVAKLVEIARMQLRKEAAAESGWREVESKRYKRKEKDYAKELVEDFQRSPENDMRCWQCNKTGHLSSSCPWGERCFTCNSSGHKRVDCPKKRRPTRAEKGKAIDVGDLKEDHRHGRTGGAL